MLKNAYAEGALAALEKFAMSPALKQRAMSAALGRRGMQANPDTPVTSAALHAARTGRPLNPVAGSGVMTPDVMQAAGLGTAAPGAMNAVRRFGAGQVAHGQNLLKGVGGMLSGGNLAGPGRTMAWNAAKGLAPTLGGVAALGIGSTLLGGDDNRQQQQQQQPNYLR